MFYFHEVWKQNKAEYRFGPASTLLYIL